MIMTPTTPSPMNKTPLKLATVASRTIPQLVFFRPNQDKPELKSITEFRRGGTKFHREEEEKSSVLLCEAPWFSASLCVPVFLLVVHEFH